MGKQQQAKQTTKNCRHINHKILKLISIEVRGVKAYVFFFYRNAVICGKSLWKKYPSLDVLVCEF